MVHELGLNLKVIAVTAEPAQSEELSVGTGELGTGRAVG